MYSNIKATRLDTFYGKSGSLYYPFAYLDNVISNNASVYYHSTNIGLDVQQVFTTNQKKILSAFIGLGASVNFSVVSQISYSQNQETGINLTDQPLNSYEISANYNLTNKTDSVKGGGSDKVKSSFFYQVYIPFGFNIRLGKNDKKIISHFYLTSQVRLGISILKIQSVNAFVFRSSYETFGVKYKF